jgi:hypothetical protein
MLPSRIRDVKDSKGDPVYSLFAKVLTATDFGLPQRRKRVFLTLVSYLKFLDFCSGFIEPENVGILLRCSDKKCTY